MTTTQQNAAQLTNTQTVNVDGVRYTFTREPHIDGTSEGDVVAIVVAQDAAGHDYQITWYADNPDATEPEDVVSDWSTANKARAI